MKSAKSEILDELNCMPRRDIQEELVKKLILTEIIDKFYANNKIIFHLWSQYFNYLIDMGDDDHIIGFSIDTTWYTCKDNNDVYILRFRGNSTFYNICRCDITKVLNKVYELTISGESNSVLFDYLDQFQQ